MTKTMKTKAVYLTFEYYEGRIFNKKGTEKDKRKNCDLYMLSYLGSDNRIYILNVYLKPYTKFEPILKGYKKRLENIYYKMSI